MQEKPLLLPSAKSGVIVKSHHYNWVRYVVFGVGLGAVLVGVADVTNRLARSTLGGDALFNSFAPAAALQAEALSPVATARGPISPALLSIPSLGISARVEHVGKKADGTMGTPQDYMRVAWYALGSKPGSEGNAVFAGHVNNSRTTAGIFANLSKVTIGDYVTVTNAEGKTLVYKVTEKLQYPADEAPAQEIFSRNGPQKLILITCEGDWVPELRTFDKRLVVVATPAYR